MTYYNANVYRESPTLWAHDNCLPESEFVIRASGHRQQREPWNWSPIYGGEHDCAYCGERVE